MCIRDRTSGTLISDIERHYKEICKERGIEPNAKKEPEMAVLDAEANQQEALFLIDDATYLHIQPCDSGWDYTCLLYTSCPAQPAAYGHG